MMKDRPLARWFVVLARWFAIAAIVLVLLCVAALGWSQVYYGCLNGNAPLASFYLKADYHLRPQIIQVFQQFAKVYGYRVDIAYYTPDHVQIGVELTRRDTTIWTDNIMGYAASDFPGPIEQYNVFFYNNNCIHRTKAGDITDLVTALKLSLGGVPGVTITTEP